MFYYVSELFKKLQLFFISILTIQLYLYFFTEELYIFIQNYIFTNRSSFFIEYHYIHNDIIKKPELKEINYDLYIDYHVINNSFKNTDYQIVIHIIIFFSFFFITYELVNYLRPIIYKHELFMLKIKIYIVILLSFMDLSYLKYVSLNYISTEYSVIYQSNELHQVSQLINIYIFYLLVCMSVNISMFYIFINRKQILVFNFFCIIAIYIFVKDITLLIYIIIKYIILFEIYLFINNYILKLISAFKKKN
jgi:hypothetical protein